MSDNATRVRLSFSFPDSTRKKLMKLAEAKSMKLTTYIKMVLEIHIKKLKGIG